MKRVAVLVGIKTYSKDERLGKVENAINDVLALKTKLESLGFSALSFTDIGRQKMRDIIQTLPERIGRSEVGIFYFAGHGISKYTSDEVYLVPSDFEYGTNLERIEAILTDCARATEIGKAMSQSGSPSVVIIDACRRAPLWSAQEVRRFHSFVGDFETIRPQNEQLIVFSTRNGRLAYDGQQSHSPFAAALLNEIDAPGKTLKEVFDKVKNTLERASATQAVDILADNFPPVILNARYNYRTAASITEISTGQTPILAFHVNRGKEGKDVIALGTRTRRCALVRRTSSSLGLKGRTKRLSSSIYSVLVHPSRRVIIVGCRDGALRVVADKVNEQGELNEPAVIGYHGNKSINSLCLATLDDEVISASHDGSIKVWRIEERALRAKVRNFCHESAIWSIDFWRDADLLATASQDASVKLWHLESLKEGRHGTQQALHQAIGQLEGMRVVRFSRRGKYLAAGGHNGKVYVYQRNPDSGLYEKFWSERHVIECFFHDLQRGIRKIKSADIPWSSFRIKGYDGIIEEVVKLNQSKQIITDLCFSDDGNDDCTLVTASSRDGIGFWSVKDGKRYFPFDPRRFVGSGRVNCVTFSQDGSTLYFVETNRLRAMRFPPYAMVNT